MSRISRLWQKLLSKIVSRKSLGVHPRDLRGRMGCAIITIARRQRFLLLQTLDQSCYRRYRRLGGRRGMSMLGARRGWPLQKWNHCRESRRRGESVENVE